MREFEIHANAKINIALDVIERRKDGYHNIETIMHSIKLHDTLCFEKTLRGINIESNSLYVPQDKGNLVYKAIVAIQEKFDIRDGIRVVINKRIPVGAGLAGGSADAAVCLKAMNEMFSLGLKIEDLIGIARSIGADVPFCVLGGTAFAEGIGDILTKVDNVPNLNIILVKPDISISTAWAYNNLILNKETDKTDIKLLAKELEQGHIDFVAVNMRNVFEGLIEKYYPQIMRIKDMLFQSGAIGNLMSGSGPVVFGIYNDINVMQDAFEGFCDLNMECFMEQGDNIYYNRC